MWFQCPEGTTGISVQGQEFGIEVMGEDGLGYFRAPDHFAPLIVDAGFKSVGAPKGTDLPDLPKADPERDSAIMRMTMQVQSLETERDALRTENAALRAENEALKASTAPASVPEPEFAKKK